MCINNPIAMYKQFIKPWLFLFKQERSHNIFLDLVKVSGYFPGGPIVRLFHKYDAPGLEREVFGIKFPNPVGLAAGFDFNGEHVDELSNFGFGFVEIGSLAPNPQTGSEKPRIFRLPKDQAILNRAGVRSKGVKNAIDCIQDRRNGTIVAANIFHNSESHKDEDIVKDYQTAFSLMYDFVDMFTVNVAFTNDDGLLTVMDSSALADIIDPLLDLRLCYDYYKPILIKISPDIPFAQLDAILDFCMMSGVDGVVATNSTRDVSGLNTGRKKLNSLGVGFVSGAPLYARSLSTVKHIHEYTKGRFPIIGCGGISTPEQAAEMLDAGASLIEIHSGIVYQGPKLVKRILKHLAGNQK